MEWSTGFVVRSAIIAGVKLSQNSGVDNEQPSLTGLNFKNFVSAMCDFEIQSAFVPVEPLFWLPNLNFRLGEKFPAKLESE